MTSTHLKSTNRKVNAVIDVKLFRLINVALKRLNNSGKESMKIPFHSLKENNWEESLNSLTVSMKDVIRWEQFH